MWIDQVVRPDYVEKTTNQDRRYVYHNTGHSNPNRGISKCLPYLDLNQDLVCLDAGCYQGLITAQIQEYFPKTIGNDRNKRSIEKARQLYPHISFVLGDFFKSDEIFLPNSIDIFFMLENVGQSIMIGYDPLKLVKPISSVRSVVREGGQMIFSCFNRFSIFDIYKDDFQLFFPKEPEGLTIDFINILEKTF